MLRMTGNLKASDRKRTLRELSGESTSPGLPPRLPPIGIAAEQTIELHLYFSLPNGTVLPVLSLQLSNGPEVKSQIHASNGCEPRFCAESSLVDQLIHQVLLSLGLARVTVKFQWQLSFAPSTRDWFWPIECTHSSVLTSFDGAWGEAPVTLSAKTRIDKASTFSLA
ncbi:hypothetical protein BDN67DRAFT_782377 [Paxillus ammoniavirescens]|nr:hypothetical protein BDN67DRAFT_782377 [Paxillus ammoniavirescens]